MTANAGARSRASELRRRLRVAGGLARIELHERVSEQAARRLSSVSRRWAIARATRRVAPLRRWHQISKDAFARYSTGGSAVRLSRLIDLVPPGSRIVDIGIGPGYVTGVLVRDLRPARYYGVDLRESFTEATRAMIEANDLGDRAVELYVSDIFDLDRDFWRRCDPEIVLLLEVLEHLPDPAAALRTIATRVRPRVTILLTVPLFGRLDRVWGHRSAFDRSRLQRICREAGLRIERAEPLHGTWSLVVATATGPSAPPPSSPEPGYTFRRVQIRGPAAAYRRPGDGPNVELDSSGRPVRCVVRPTDGTSDGGIRLSVPNPRVVRLDLAIEPPAGARRLRVRGLDRSGSVRLEWVGDGGQAGLRGRATYVLRPGKRAGPLVASRGGSPRGVAWIELSVEPEPGTEVTLTLHRAAYLEAPANRFRPPG